MTRSPRTDSTVRSKPSTSSHPVSPPPQLADVSVEGSGQAPISCDIMCTATSTPVVVVVVAAAVVAVVVAVIVFRAAAVCHS